MALDSSTHGFYIIMSVDEGATVAPVFSLTADGLPALNAHNTSLLQAYFQIVRFNQSSIKQISTSSALISLTYMSAKSETPQQEEITIEYIFVLVNRKFATTSEQQLKSNQGILYHLRNLFVMTVGVEELERY